MTLGELNKWLDSEEFNNICYRYRTSETEKAHIAFEALKLHIVKKIIELSDD